MAFRMMPGMAPGGLPVLQAEGIMRNLPRGLLCGCMERRGIYAETTAIAGIPMQEGGKQGRGGWGSCGLSPCTPRACLPRCSRSLCLSCVSLRSRYRMDTPPTREFPARRGKKKERVCRKAGAFLFVVKGRKSIYDRRYCRCESFVNTLVQRRSSPRGKAGVCKGAAPPTYSPPCIPPPSSPAKARLLEGMFPK